MNSAPSSDTVGGIVLAGGSGARLGKGPKAFVQIGQSTLLHLAVSPLLEVAQSVLVALPPDRLQDGKALVSDPRVSFIPGGMRRIDTLRLLVENSSAKWLLLHDVVHPLVSAQLVTEVLAAAQQHGAAAAAAQPIQEFVYDPKGQQVAKPGQAWTVQKPIVFRRTAILEAFAQADAQGVSHDAGALEILAAAHIVPRLIQGCRYNPKITEASDLALTQALLPLHGTGA